MILSIGADIVDARRIQAAMDRHPNKFAKRIFSDAEITASKESSNQANYFAKRFAVKAAVSEALIISGVKGCGMREEETLSAPNGATKRPLPGR